MKRPDCVVCNQPASHVALFGDGGNHFNGSAVCAQHKEHPSNQSNTEALVTRIEGFSVPDAAIASPANAPNGATK